MAKNYNVLALKVLSDLSRAIESEPGKIEYAISMPEEIENFYQATKLLHALSVNNNVSLRDMTSEGQSRHWHAFVFYLPETKSEPSLSEKAAEVYALIERMAQTLMSTRNPNGLTLKEWNLINEVFHNLGVK